MRRFCSRACMDKSPRKQKPSYATVEDYIDHVGVTQCPTVHLIAPDHMRPNYGLRSRRTQ